MASDPREPRVPPTAWLLCQRFNAWIVGSAALLKLRAEDPEPEDVDVMVPWPEWQEACSLIPRNCTTTLFRGWRFVEDGITVDVWPDTLDRLASSPKFVAAWHPMSGTRLVKDKGG